MSITDKKRGLVKEMFECPKIETVWRYNYKFPSLTERQTKRMAKIVNTGPITLSENCILIKNT